MIGVYDYTVILTYMSLISGMLGIIVTVTGAGHPQLGVFFLMLSGILDAFDGKVARTKKDRTEFDKKFGIQIDSLADTVNFLCLPVIIMLSLGMSSIIDVVIYCIFILCGLSRLGYFNVHAKLDSPVKFYNGLPVTSTAIIYPIIGLLHGQVPNSTFQIVLISATLITAILFVFRVSVPKFKGPAYIIIPILAVLLSILLLVIR